MIKPTSLANAVTAMMMALYFVCTGISLVAPGFILGLAQSWVHTVNMEIVRATSPFTFGSFIYGLISLSILTWIVSYGTVALYNYFAHREEAVRYHQGLRAI